VSIIFIQDKALLVPQTLPTLNCEARETFLAKGKDEWITLSNAKVLLNQENVRKG
jgi:hypothetical protein